MADKKEEKNYLVPPRTQTDLEARQAGDSSPSGNVVNPNPFGEDAYAGTDPIYQNHANDTEKPLRAGKGAEKKAEDEIREAHKFPKGADVVSDAGLGGKAVRVGNPVVEESSDSSDGSDGKDNGGDPAEPPVAPVPPASPPTGSAQNPAENS